MMNIGSRILPAFALLVAIAIFFIYINPTWTGPIVVAKTTIALDDQALVAAQQYAEQQNKLAAARDAIDPANLAAVTTLLPDSVDNVGLILDLNALAARSGLSVANVDVASNSGTTAQSSSGPSAGNADPVGSIDLSLSATGTFAAFQTFLNGVERSQRLLDVRDVVVKGSDTGIYTYQMTIRLYWLR
ncbi:MAG: type 4a pilus biogenesis protein PilO [Minisyncoccota bacterium]